MNPRSPNPPVSPRVLSATLRFGACELRLGSREIYFCRQYSPITPRAFEVLLYLIEHRERVVSKDELLDAIWRTKFVSESVLARMVMKIRRAIGDTGHPRQLIRTVHRIGYRFIGTLDTVVAQPSAPWPEINSPGRRPRLALLPFRNATGIAEFAWVEWGLVTVLIDALERAERFSVVAMRDSILALGTLFESAPDEQRSLAVLRATAADFSLMAVVNGTIGRFRVDWTLRSSQGECATHSVEGDWLPSLMASVAEGLALHMGRPHGPHSSIADPHSGAPEDIAAR